MDSIIGNKDREFCQKWKSLAIKLKNTKSVTNQDLTKNQRGQAIRPSARFQAPQILKEENSNRLLSMTNNTRFKTINKRICFLKEKN